jgi:hypothetical protein
MSGDQRDQGTPLGPPVLSRRVGNALRRAGLWTLEEVADCARGEVAAFPMIGKGAMREIDGVLAQRQLDYRRGRRRTHDSPGVSVLDALVVAGDALRAAALLAVAVLGHHDDVEEVARRLLVFDGEGWHLKPLGAALLDVVVAIGERWESLTPDRQTEALNQLPDGHRRVLRELLVAWATVPPKDQP